MLGHRPFEAGLPVGGSRVAQPVALPVDDPPAALILEHEIDEAPQKAAPGGIGGADPPTYTTPIETMQAYYDELKAGPWAGLSWWVFGGGGAMQGGLDYYDRTLLHSTREHPEGVPYCEEMLDYWHDAYVEFKRGIFEDVVYGQFGHLNPRPE